MRSKSFLTQHKNKQSLTCKEEGELDSNSIAVKPKRKCLKSSTKKTKKSQFSIKSVHYVSYRYQNGILVGASSKEIRYRPLKFVCLATKSRRNINSFLAFRIGLPITFVSCLWLVSSKTEKARIYLIIRSLYFMANYKKVKKEQKQL